MAGDWIRIHRKLLKSAVFEQNSGALLKLWLYLLLHANWAERQLADGTVLQPGQLTRGYRRMAFDLRWGTSKVVRWLKRLELLGNITIQQRSGTLAQVVTICQWGCYQQFEGDEQNATGNATGNEKKKERTKEGKKGRKETPLPPFAFPDGFDTPEVSKAIEDWLAYRKKLGKALRSPPDQIPRLLKTFPDGAAFVVAVDHSIAQGYQGCFSPGASHGSKQRNLAHDPGSVFQG